VSTRKKAVRGPSEKKPAVIEEVLSEVQKALQEAQSKIQDPDFPKLDSVVLTLQTAITVGVGGKLKFLIFSFGMTWQREQAQELVLTLTPLGASSLEEKSLSSQLAKAIVEAADGVRNAKTGTSPLDLNALNVSITFIVTKEGSGGITIAPVTLELSGNLKKKALHKIELKFKKK
jgi:hypothetical protein